MNTAKVDFHMYVDVILFLMCKESHTICNVYINLTHIMFGSCFTSCLLEGACLIYVNCMCVCVCVHSGVQHTLRCVFALFYFVLCTLSCQHSLDFHFWIALWYSLTFSYRKLTVFPNCIWTPTFSTKHINLASVVWHTSLLLFHLKTVITNFNGEGGNLSW